MLVNINFVKHFIKDLHFVTKHLGIPEVTNIKQNYFEWSVIVSTKFNVTLIPESLFASASPILASLLTCAVLAIPRACRYPFKKYTNAHLTTLILMYPLV